jgi:tetratricopeptide (TPR) repeat protein
VRLEPSFSDAHTNLGAALATKGRIREAIGHYNAALRINPDDADAHYDLAIALASQGKRADAIAHLQEALRIEPGYSDAHLSLALQLFFAGDYRGAWSEAYLCRDSGGALPADFLGDLSRKMPDPGR